MAQASSTRPDRKTSAEVEGQQWNRVLIITMTDYDAYSNDHDRLKYYVPDGGRAALLYKTMNHSARLWDMLCDSVTLRVAQRRTGDIDLVAVDPLFNYRAGIRSNREAGAAAGSGRGIVMALVRLLSPLAVLRDVFLLPSLIYAAWSLDRQHRPLCIGIGPWGTLTGLMLRKFGLVAFVVYRDRDYEPGLMADRLRRWYTERTERFALKRADVVISQGRLLAELRHRQTGRQVHNIRTGVDWDRFAQADGRDPGSKTLAYVGNLVPWSGVGMAIEALPTVLASVPNARLLVIGTGLPAYERRLKDRVAELALDDSVTFVGRRAPGAIPQLLAQARVGLANSEPVDFRKYACPLKVLEYMASGLPVIATTATEAEAVVEDYQCGVAVPYAVASLAQAAIRLLSDDDLCERLGVNGRQASRNMTWEKQVSQEMRIIKDSWERADRESSGALSRFAG